jgi:UDP-glucose 4-epimerase
VYVLEAARDAGAHVIVASSSSIYGSTIELPKHENLPARPLSPYGASKLATEAYALAWGQSFGMPVLAFRFFNVYGPLQPAGHAYAAVIPTFIDAAMSARPLPVNGDGRQTRDFTYVGTVCSVLSDAVRRRVTNSDPVNLAFGTRVNLLELVDMLKAALGRDLHVEHRAARAGDIRDSQASSEQLQRLFPSVRPVPLSEGLAETVQWFQNTRKP